VIRNFEPLLVPGLLQTEEYAREVLAVEGHDSRAEGLVELRMHRQELLERSKPPSLHFILDEAVIRRVVGGPDVMRRQLNHLRELAQRPNITVRIMPFTEGIYPRLRVPYVLFEFPLPEDEDILFIENPQGGMIVREGSPEEEDEITPVAYLGVFWQLEQRAPKDDAIPMIDEAIARLVPSVAHVPEPPPRAVVDEDVADAS
jgi:hypothetical protein